MVGLKGELKLLAFASGCTYCENMPEVEPYRFDTHAMVKEFIASGFTEKQAEAQVRALSDLISYNLATKSDIERVRKEIAELRKDSEADIAGVHRDIADVHKEIENLRKETKTDIELLKRDLTIRLGALMVTGVGIILGVLTVIITRLP